MFSIEVYGYVGQLAIDRQREGRDRNCRRDSDGRIREGNKGVEEALALDALTLRSEARAGHEGQGVGGGVDRLVGRQNVGTSVRSSDVVPSQRRSYRR